MNKKKTTLNLRCQFNKSYSNLVVFMSFKLEVYKSKYKCLESLIFSSLIFSSITCSSFSLPPPYPNLGPQLHTNYPILTIKWSKAELGI